MLRRRAVAATCCSTDIVFARSEPRQQPFVYGNPSRPAGACGAHVRGIRDRRPRDPCPAGRACDVRVPARRTIVGGGPAASAGSRAGRYSPWRGPQAIPPVGEPRRDRVRSFAGRRRVPRDHSPGGSGTSSLRASFFSILVPNTLLLFFFARRLLHRWASLGGIASDPLRAGGASREITARGGAVRRPFMLVSFLFQFLIVFCYSSFLRIIGGRSSRRRGLAGQLLPHYLVIVGGPSAGWPASCSPTTSSLSAGRRRGLAGQLRHNLLGIVGGCSRGRVQQDYSGSGKTLGIIRKLN